MYRPIRVILFLASLLLSGTADAGPVGTLQPALRLNDLVLKLAEGPPPLQADLARIALQSLSDVYAQEADRARHDEHRRARKQDLQEWVAGVERLSQDYATLAGEMRPDTPVLLAIGPDHSLHLTIDGRLVVVSSPRMNEQTRFEQDIVRQFCALDSCADLVDVPVAAELSDEHTYPDSQWIFSDHAGPSCSSGDGLEFQFRNLENLVRKREICAEAVDELHRLVGAISREFSLGVRVDWDVLAIYDRPEPDRQKVVLNRDGESIPLSLPFLSRHPELLHRVVPWLSASAHGEPFTLVVINAGEALGKPGKSLE